MSSDNEKSPPPATPPWGQICFDTEGLGEEALEELACVLVADYGAAGSVHDSSGQLTAYFNLPVGECTSIGDTISRLYSLRCSVEPVVERNWTADSAQVWQPVIEDALRIIPVASEQMEAPPEQNELRIYPGTGFGTGHHHTTRMLLRLQQDLARAGCTPASVLDIGTGSGILAIAAWKLFHSPVTAFDTDPRAIGNAEINVGLNCCQAAIQLFTGTLTDCSGMYDLILANLYAELLIEMHHDIAGKIKPGGQLLISGILEELWPAVRDAFTAAGFTVENEMRNVDFYTVSPDEKIWIAAQMRWSAA